MTTATKGQTVMTTPINNPDRAIFHVLTGTPAKTVLADCKPDETFGLREWKQAASTLLQVLAFDLGCPFRNEAIDLAVGILEVCHCHVLKARVIATAMKGQTQ